MKKLKSSFINMICSLGFITVGAGLILSWTYTVTESPIKKAEEEKQSEAIKRVLPPSNDKLIISDPVEYKEDGENIPVIVFPAFDNDVFIGAAVKSYSMEGFSGEIDVMFGFSADGTVSGYSVVSHAETPGLGSKMDEWFRMNQADRSIIGIKPEINNPVKVKKDGGTIDGITAATISSRAFLKSLNRAFEAFEAYKQDNQSTK